MSTRRATGPYYCTKATLDRLHAELAELESRGREELRELFAAAQDEGGNLDENAAYQMAISAQELLDRRVLDLRELIARAVVQRRSTKQVTAGVVVTLRVRVPRRRASEQRFVVDSGLAVVHDEDISVVSPSSPLGLALLGRAVGDELAWQAPAGRFTATVLAIAAPPAPRRTSARPRR